jgi:hypothetical protein
MTTLPRSHRGLIAVYGAAAVLVLLGQWQPLLFFSYSPEPWILVLSEAASGKYGFGTDVVFTSGPLSDLYTRLFNPETVATMVVVSYALIAVQVALLTTLAARSQSLFLPLLLFSAFYFTISRDVLLMSTPLLVALVALGRPAERWSTALTLAGAVASAVSTLVKFSVFPLSVGLFLLVDLNRLRFRQVPLAAICYGTAFYLSFVLLAPAGSDFLGYFTGSLETSSGYSSAMAIVGPWTDLALYAALLAASVLALIAIERRRREDGGTFELSAAARVVATAVFLWLSFKIGFVRHDLHVLTAFASLTVAVSAYGLSRAPASGAALFPAAILAAVVVAAGFYSPLRLALDPGTRYPLPTTLRDLLLATPTEIQRTIGFLGDPRAWLADHQKKREAFLSTLASMSPIDELDGTIDSIASNQSTLIGAGLAYRPRPTIQEYTTYTSALIERNRAFFAGANGPDFVLFDPATIDDRLPALAEGSSWPILLSRFAPHQMTSDGVLLRRRREPLGEILSAGESGEARMGDSLPIEFGSEPLFLSLDLRLSLPGRLLDVLYRPAFVYLGVTPVGGREQVYRLVPAIAREGFVVSPLVRTASDYLLLADGVSAERIAPVRAIRVFAGFAGNLTHDQQFTFTVRRIDRARLAAAHDESPAAATSFARTRAFETIIAAAGGSNPGFRVIAAGLYAHAPRRFPVDTAGSSSLAVSFGMRRGSWSGNAEGNGVCFRVLDREGNKAIWERCLDPVGSEADRTPQRETIELPAGTERVMLETDCRGDCRWDWSYWSEIAPMGR